MTYKTIGDRIKYHRKRLGLTQEQLAERMGVSAQAVSKWENNLSCPDISVLPVLADVFGISVDELLGKQPQEEEAQQEEKSSDGWRWEWKRNSKTGGLCFALFIITVAALLLLRGFVERMDIAPWTILWTCALTYLGIAGLLDGFSLFCTIMAAAGVFFLLKAYGVIAVSVGMGTILPVVLLIWGVGLLVDVFRGKRKKKTHGKRKLHADVKCDDGYLHCEMSFGEYRAVVAPELLRGGSIESSFGDFTVDFSACKALAPDCTLSVDNSFGELTLLVPDRFRVEVAEKDAFASAASVKGSPAEPTSGVMQLHIDNSFGSIEIRYVD